MTYITSASSPSTVLWAFHTIQPSSCHWFCFGDIECLFGQQQSVGHAEVQAPFRPCSICMLAYRAVLFFSNISFNARKYLDTFSLSMHILRTAAMPSGRRSLSLDRFLIMHHHFSEGLEFFSFILCSFASCPAISNKASIR